VWHGKAVRGGRLFPRGRRRSSNFEQQQVQQQHQGRRGRRGLARSKNHHVWLRRVPQRLVHPPPGNTRAHRGHFGDRVVAVRRALRLRRELPQGPRGTRRCLFRARGRGALLALAPVYAVRDGEGAAGGRAERRERAPEAAEPALPAVRPRQQLRTFFSMSFFFFFFFAFTFPLHSQQNSQKQNKNVSKTV